jgi:hypothetical protein
MARTSARNVNPSLSSDAADKLTACCNWAVGKHRSGATYKLAPMYFDGCWAWYQSLSSQDQDAVATIADVMASAHKGAAEGMAASLPPPPTVRGKGAT